MLLLLNSCCSTISEESVRFAARRGLDVKRKADRKYGPHQPQRDEEGEIVVLRHDEIAPGTRNRISIRQCNVL